MTHAYANDFKKTKMSPHTGPADLLEHCCSFLLPMHTTKIATGQGPIQNTIRREMSQLTSCFIFHLLQPLASHFILYC